MISLPIKANKLAQNNDLIPQQRHINASVRLNYTERITAIAGQISESHSRRLTQRDREKTGKKTAIDATYLLMEPSTVDVDDGCFPSDVSMAAQQWETNMKQVILSSEIR